jgi:hypothetical protein
MKDRGNNKFRALMLRYINDCMTTNPERLTCIINFINKYASEHFNIANLHTSNRNGSPPAESEMKQT